MFLANIWLFCTVVGLTFVLEVNSIKSTNFSNRFFEENSELAFVHVLFRHGDRSPTQQCPGSPYNVSYWPDGWGELTSLGKQQQYELGKWLRSRYDNFLSAMYNATNIYVQSSDIDRTLMSVEANLAGLYPPKKYQIWNPDLLWQPVPVHTRPDEEDYLIAGKVPKTCLSYYNALKKYYQSPEMSTEIANAKPYLEYLSTKLGVKIDKIQTLILIRDCWACETAHKLQIPEWAQQLMEDEEFNKISLFLYQTFSATPQLAKFATGFLFKDILDRFTSKAQKTLDPDRNFWIYSSHDSVVLNFVNSLGVFDNKFVGFAAALIFELRFFKNEYYVQIIYKNPNPQNIQIPGCGFACPLSKLKEMYANILPKKSFDDECQIK